MNTPPPTPPTPPTPQGTATLTYDEYQALMRAIAPHMPDDSIRRGWLLWQVAGDDADLATVDRAGARLAFARWLYQHGRLTEYPPSAA